MLEAGLWAFVFLINLIDFLASNSIAVQRTDFGSGAKSAVIAFLSLF